MELGPQRDLGFDLLAGVCRLLAHPPEPWVAGTPTRLGGGEWLVCDQRLLHRRESAGHWFAQLWLVF